MLSFVIFRLTFLNNSILYLIMVRTIIPTLFTLNSTLSLVMVRTIVPNKLAVYSNSFLTKSLRWESNGVLPALLRFRTPIIFADFPHAFPTSVINWQRDRMLIRYWQCLSVIVIGCCQTFVWKSACHKGFMIIELNPRVTSVMDITTNNYR